MVVERGRKIKEKEEEKKRESEGMWEESVYQ